jgi:hypothetical protein
MTTTIANPIPPSAGKGGVHEVYVQRLRTRLARPTITVEDARDGVVDCFVSTYFEGVQHGLRQLVGVQADPDEVARVTVEMFRKRLAAHGASYDKPTVDALAAVKEEVDHELHFAELPAELDALHDQVCLLLLAKADRELDHRGDAPVVTPGAAAARAPTASAIAASAGRSSAANGDVCEHLRSAIAAFFDECARAAQSEPTAALELRLTRSHALLSALSQFE